MRRQPALELRSEPFPERIDEICNKRAVPFEFLSKRRMWTRRTWLARRYRPGRLGYCDGARVGDEAEADLAPTG